MHSKSKAFVIIIAALFTVSCSTTGTAPVLSDKSVDENQQNESARNPSSAVRVESAAGVPLLALIAAGTCALGLADGALKVRRNKKSLVEQLEMDKLAMEVENLQDDILDLTSRNLGTDDLCKLMGKEEGCTITEEEYIKFTEEIVRQYEEETGVGISFGRRIKERIRGALSSLRRMAGTKQRSRGTLLGGALLAGSGVALIAYTSKIVGVSSSVIALPSLALGSGMWLVCKSALVYKLTGDDIKRLRAEVDEALARMAKQR